MAFKKYQAVEKTNLLSKDEHRKVRKFLRKTGKRSVSELSDEEKTLLDKQK